MKTFVSRFVAGLLVVVFSMAGLLACSTMSQYHKTALEARESVLRDDLMQMRKLIDQYTFDQGKPPQTLEDLTRRGYMREVPDDPMTSKKDWRVIMGEHPSAKGAKGIIDVRSASTAKSVDGKPYNEW
ncbi:MAG TPA: hypothetical protein VGW12_06000 [Pyrinomonadaceae bacterium]|nr:hypothetical protein [Pyrinomonadaceae bacterium]